MGRNPMSDTIQIVNGFQCRNCTDVDNAKKHIHPAHPEDGPYGVYAKNKAGADGKSADPSVVFGGALTSLKINGLANSQAPIADMAGEQSGSPASVPPALSASAPGSIVDLQV